MEKRYCEITRQPYTISDEEVEVYREFGLPLPSVCPQERCRRQLSFRNDKQFFWRKCDQTGKKIYSVFPEKAPFPVVSADYWQSSEWDGTHYGQEFDFKRLFIEQLLELWQKVPRPAYRLQSALDTRASHNSADVGQSFLLFNARSVACSFYSVGIWDSHHCCDCYYVNCCEYCYECIHCHDCKKLRWSEFCRGCEDSWFLSHCSNCSHCLFCSGLEGKNYHIFNRPVSKEGFEKALGEWSLNARPRVELAQEQFSEFLVDKPIPHIFSDNPESSSGNCLWGCHQAHHCFDCFDSENIYHCHALRDANNCVDGFAFGEGLSDSAQFVQVGDGATRLINCIECWGDVTDLAYCTFCEKSSNLFGCVGLRNREYCIFNKQQSKKRYLRLKSDIIEHLKTRAVWGKFFPASFSGFAYNQSSADEYMPLSRIPAKMMGFRWDDQLEFIRPSELLGGTEQAPDRRFSEIPNSLADVSESAILEAIYICEISGRPFRITSDELSLYRILSVPPPTRAFEQRHHERVMRLAPRAVGTRKSAQSDVELQSCYPENWRRPVISSEEWEETAKKGSG